MWDSQDSDAPSSSPVGLNARAVDSPRAFAELLVLELLESFEQEWKQQQQKLQHEEQEKQEKQLSSHLYNHWATPPSYTHLFHQHQRLQQQGQQLRDVLQALGYAADLLYGQPLPMQLQQGLQSAVNTVCSSSSSGGGSEWLQTVELHQLTGCSMLLALPDLLQQRLQALTPDEASGGGMFSASIVLAAATAAVAPAGPAPAAPADTKQQQGYTTPGSPAVIAAALNGVSASLRAYIDAVDWEALQSPAWGPCSWLLSPMLVQPLLRLHQLQQQHSTDALMSDPLVVEGVAAVAAAVQACIAFDMRRHRYQQQEDYGGRQGHTDSVGGSGCGTDARSNSNGSSSPSRCHGGWTVPGAVAAVVTLTKGMGCQLQPGTVHAITNVAAGQLHTLSAGTLAQLVQLSAQVSAAEVDAAIQEDYRRAMWEAGYDDGGFEILLDPGLTDNESMVYWDDDREMYISIFDRELYSEPYRDPDCQSDSEGDSDGEGEGEGDSEGDSDGEGEGEH